MTSTAKFDVNAQQAAHLGQSAMLLSTYLTQHYSDDLELFAKEYGLPLINVRRWLAKRAVIFSQRIYLKASKTAERRVDTVLRESALEKGTVLAMTLEDYLLTHCDNKQTRFADMHGFSQQQVNRWANGDCAVLFNQVYRMQKELIAISATVLH